MSEPPPTLLASEPVSVALPLFAEGGWPILLVSDAAGSIIGIVKPTHLFDRIETLRPRAPGGMATPFGVYLTNGVVKGGVGPWALVATGALLISLYIVSFVAAREFFILKFWKGWGLTSAMIDTAIAGLSSVLFLVGLRLMPMSGIHAAEHMAVHAIERGEPLTKDVVRRMPRVHPRCGTNLAAAATIFLGIGTARWFEDPTTQLLVAALVTAMTWRRVGSWLQEYVTTKTPTDAQLEMGIKAGRELLENFRQSPVAYPTVTQKLLHSGLPQLLAGSFGITLLIDGLVKLFPDLAFLKVYS